MPLSERVAKFKELETEDQVEIAMLDRYVVHPPHSDFTNELARGGREQGIVLLRIVKNTDDERTAETIVYVFQKMRDRGDYDVTRDTEAMAGLRDVVFRMKCPGRGCIPQEAYEKLACGRRADY